MPRYPGAVFLSNVVRTRQIGTQCGQSAVLKALGCPTPALPLAERAWELASLRVLGMTRAEVSWLLLGELGLQLLAAVPLGWLAGYGLSAFIVGMIEPETFRIPLIESRTYAFAALVVLGVGVASALIVRRRVDRLDLVAVL